MGVKSIATLVEHNITFIEHYLIDGFEMRNNGLIYIDALRMFLQYHQSMFSMLCSDAHTLTLPDFPDTIMMFYKECTSYEKWMMDVVFGRLLFILLDLRDMLPTDMHDSIDRVRTKIAAVYDDKK